MLVTSDRYLSAPISVGNIADVEAFARSIIGRGLPSAMYLRPDEREDEIGNVFEQLVDWFRPVNTPWCGAWTRVDQAGGQLLVGPGCGNLRDSQHAWDCDALRPQRVRRSECLGCGCLRRPEGPTVEVHGVDKAGEPWRREVPPAAVHYPDCPQPDGRAGWGCHACGQKRGERHAEMCAHRHERQQRYDPLKTNDFALFARFKLTTYYVPDLCRRLLGRNGGRIAERSHSELDERAESGHRPWESGAPEQDGVRADLGSDARGGQAGRDRARARGAALLGLRPAR